MGQGASRCRAHAPRVNGAGDADTYYNGLAAYGIHAISLARDAMT